MWKAKNSGPPVTSNLITSQVATRNPRSTPTVDHKGNVMRNANCPNLTQWVQIHSKTRPQSQPCLPVRDRGRSRPLQHPPQIKQWQKQFWIKEKSRWRKWWCCCWDKSPIPQCKKTTNERNQGDDQAGKYLEKVTALQRLQKTQPNGWDYPEKRNNYRIPEANLASNEYNCCNPTSRPFPHWWNPQNEMDHRLGEVRWSQQKYPR